MKAFVLAALMLAASCGRPANPAPSTRVVVLGIDGMDPAFVERHWQSLPNLRKLADRGSFQRLQTTMPPQSPVAWSTFTTGLPPSAHGVFDFVHRDPAALQPFSSIAEIQPPRRTFHIGPYEIPLTNASIRSVRHGAPFWQILSQHGVPVTVLRMPANFPPAECEGLTLSGMGVPDLKGTFSSFAFYTNDPQELPRDVPGGRIVTFQLDGGTADLAIEGPANSLRRDHALSTVNLHLVVDAAAQAARFTIAGEAFLLKQGEWSHWIPVSFALLGPFYSARGMFRIYAKELGDTVKLYISPVNLDPVSPELPIAAPASFSADLARKVGRYYTQGIAEDTAALRQGVFSRDEYLAQSNLVSKEHLQLFHQSLKEFRNGLLFFHFFGIDQNSHMLWGKHEDQLLATYELVDREIGAALSTIGDAAIFVMSDHGFTSFDRAVHLNAWLRDQGFLSWKEGTSGGSLSEIDWSRTKAYALGLNGLYLNLRGREAQGIVAPSEAPALVQELTRKLLSLRDTADNSPVVDTLAAVKERGFGSGPDLLVGYYPRFRSSWQNALGGSSAEIIEDNADAWIGDHCVGARHVPGVLFLNRKAQRANVTLEDVTATVLREFGMQPPPGSPGVAF